jgi:hypothetical protein
MTQRLIPAVCFTILLSCAIASSALTAACNDSCRWLIGAGAVVCWGLVVRVGWLWICKGD